ncbi:MAG: DUF3179 domain-containing protein [Pseudomonadota bacterium]
MSISRRQLLITGAASALMPMPALAQRQMDLYHAFRSMIGNDPGAVMAALRLVGETGDISHAPSLITAMRFTRAPAPLFDEALQTITGADHQGWFDWMLWQEAQDDLVPHPTYFDFKRDLYLLIDPNFEVFLQQPYFTPEASKIRIEEIAWGGVRKDGIPSLDNPELIDADAATYLKDDDLVFGVAINGDARAYPLRIMGWHEMFNEVIGGVPVALAYCTLCGSGILFETDVEGREAPFVFGSSGFLYRSNKLMFDRETHTLWNQFTGEPVLGPLAEEPIALKQRPVVITTWAAWRAQNPETKVLSLNTGHRRDYGSGVVYNRYFASPDLMFPTQTDETRLKQKDYVFGIRTVGAARAWPLGAFEGMPVINDQVGGLNVVLVGDPDGRTVRAYDRGERSFTADLTSDGTTWSQTEDALLGPDGESAPRLPGHIAYWFAWDGYLGLRSSLYPD